AAGSEVFALRGASSAALGPSSEREPARLRLGVAEAPRAHPEARSDLPAVPRRPIDPERSHPAEGRRRRRQRAQPARPVQALPRDEERTGRTASPMKFDITDVLIALGAALMIYGVSRISPAVAFIVGGLLATAVGLGLSARRPR